MSNEHDSFFTTIESNIRQHAKHQKITLSDLASAIEMTEAGFYKMLSTESIKVKTLRKIAEVLHQPISSFFVEFVAPAQSQPYIRKQEYHQAAEPQGIYTTEKDALKKQIELLESQIADKNKIIELLSKK